MSIQTHLAELERRHQALEQEIYEAQTHPATDDVQPPDHFALEFSVGVTL